MNAPIHETIPPSSPAGSANGQRNALEALGECLPSRALLATMVTSTALGAWASPLFAGIALTITAGTGFFSSFRRFRDSLNARSKTKDTTPDLVPLMLVTVVGAALMLTPIQMQLSQQEASFHNAAKEILYGNKDRSNQAYVGKNYITAWGTPLTFWGSASRVCATEVTMIIKDDTLGGFYAYRAASRPDDSVEWKMTGQSQKADATKCELR